MLELRLKICYTVQADIRSRIEVVITGLTRNQFAGQPARGFESLRLRNNPGTVLNTKNHLRVVFFHSVRSLITSPAIIRPATDGTKATLPGVLLRDVPAFSSGEPLSPGVRASSVE